MKKLTFVLLIISIMMTSGCKTESNDGNTEQPKTEALAKNTNQPKTTVNKINNPSANNPTPNQSRIMRARARPKSQMELSYPYDIDLKTADGDVLKSNEVFGNGDKPTVLLFWLTTCFPCKIEMTNIAKVYPEWEKETGVRLIAISTDFEKNYPKFSQMVKDKNWPWEAYNDTNREFRQVMPGGLNGLPQTFLLDKNGNIVYHKRKYRNGDEFILYDEIKKLVGKA